MVSIGKCIQQLEGYKSFIPGPFPPQSGFDIAPSLAKKANEATLLVGRLDGVTQLLPDKNYFLQMFVRKDATRSSQIEGTQATMTDAIEASGAECNANIPEDVDDILHYISALNYGLERAKSFPFSLRFITELHEKLLFGARTTQNAYPGEFRRSQNWIGGTRPDNAMFVPPTVEAMKDALGDFEKFIYADDEYSPIIKAGLLHAQFETIHPFNDGNGRTGRMLITMYLWHKKLLSVPVLYLSAYFKKHQQLYYNKLNSYHKEDSGIAGWLHFFLDGVIEIAQSAIDTCKSIIEIREQDMRKLQSLGKATAPEAVKVLTNLFATPKTGIAEIMEWSGYASRQSGYTLIKNLEELGILTAVKEPGKYGKKYIYQQYLNLFEDEN